MIWQILISGFSLGVLSSFHCIGMCGPLALSLPVQKKSIQIKILSSVLYNLGRISTYAFMGFLMGIIGRSFFIAGFQQYFSIFIGAVILIFLVFKVTGKQFFVTQKFNQKIQQFVLLFLNKEQNYTMYLLGMANGLLPCGMVYLAIAGALAFGDINSSILFMIFFGLGTMPAMMTLTLFRFSIQNKSRAFIKKLTPFVIAIMGLMLIARGLNLGVPYLSPKLQSSATEKLICH